MTVLLNLNHFWITQAKLCLKDTSVKASFMFVTIFFIFKRIPGEKSWLTLPVPSILKLLKKKMTYLFSHFLVVPQKGFMKARRPYVIFPSLFGIGTTSVKTVFVELPIYAISVSLTTGIHKNRTWSVKTNLVC